MQRIECSLVLVIFLLYAHPFLVDASFLSKDGTYDVDKSLMLGTQPTFASIAHSILIVVVAFAAIIMS